MGRYRRRYDDDDWDDWDDDDWDDDSPRYRHGSRFHDDDDDDDFWDEYDDWDEDEYDDWKDDDYYPRFDPEFLGEYGEQLTEEELETLSEMKNSGRILHNLYVPKPNGKTTEIDLVYVTRKGVFVIESKNYSGWIFGNEKDRQWTATFPNGERRRFYNPVKQNANHVKWLKRYVGTNFPCYSLIVFSERCELKKIMVTAPGVGVVKRDKLVPLLLKSWDKFRDYFSDKMIDLMYDKLSKCANADYETRQRHVDDVMGNE